jgi:integrase
MPVQAGGHNSDTTNSPLGTTVTSRAGFGTGRTLPASRIRDHGPGGQNEMASLAGELPPVVRVIIDRNEENQNPMTDASKARGARGEGKLFQLKSGKYAGRWRRVITVKDPTGVTQTRTFTEPTKTAVVKKARAWQEANGLVVPTKLAKGRTVSDVLTRYLRDFEVRSRRGEITANNLAWYEGAVRRIRRDAIGRMEATKVTAHAVDEMVERMLQGGWGRNPKLGQVYVRRLRSVLNQAMVIAVKEGVVTANPVAASKRVKVKRVPMEALSAMDTRRFLQAAEADRLYAFFAVLVGLGLRRGEACGLKWSDIDLRNGVLKVRRQVKREPVDGTVKAVPGELKTPESRRDLQLPGFVLNALKEHRSRQTNEREQAVDRWEDEDWVFTSPSRPGHYLDPSHAYRRARAIARSVGIKDLTIHKIRHSYLTALAVEGTHPSVMQAVAGHSDPKITLDIYTHVGTAAKKVAADAAERAFGGPAPELG